MPLSDEQKRRLDAAKADIDVTALDTSLNAAVRGNPDKTAKVVELADWGQLPRDTVERNLPEVDARHHREQIPDAASLRRGYPVTAEYLKDADNAAVSIDDVDTLTGLEDALHYESWATTFGRGFVSRVNELVGNLMQAGGTIADDIGSGPGITIGEDGISWRWESPDDVPSALTVMGKYVSEGEAHRVGYVPRFTWDKFKGEMTAANLAGYILETGIKSLPDMAATLATLPAYVVSRSEEIAEARVENEGRSDVDTSDLAKSLPTAVLVSLLERIGSQAVFGHGSVNTLRDVGAAAGGAFVREGATEFIQEGVEYYGETIGTRRPVRHEEALDRALAGMVAGGPFGGGIRGTTATVELIANRTMKDSVVVGESMQEQRQLDTIIELAQRSKTNERAQDRFATFLRGAGQGRGVYVPSSVITDLGDAAPDYLIRQAEQHPDGDAFIPMDRLGAEIVPNEQLLEAIRPHARLSPRSLSAQELAEGTDATIQAMVEAAAAEQDLKTEADAIYEQVKDQLVGTGRQSDATAKYSAALYPAMATRLAAEYDITPRQAFEAMGFELVGPDGRGTGGVELNQLGMFSAVDRAVAQLKMPEWKNEGGRVRGDQIWQKLQPGKAPGVRAEEIEWLGLQEFLTPYADAGISRQTHETFRMADPNALPDTPMVPETWMIKDKETGEVVGPTFDSPKAANKFIKSGGQLQFTREEVQAFVQSNGVTIDETIAEDQEIEDEKMEWNDPEVWEEPEAWTNEVDEYFMPQYDDGEYIFNFDPESDWLSNSDNFQQFASDHDGGDMDQQIIDDEDVDALREYFERSNIDFDEALRQAAREKAKEAATEYAHEQYMENPYYTVYSPNSDLYLFGNGDIGWDIRDGSTDYQNSVSTGDPVYSMAEAQIQALEWAINNGRLTTEEDESVARWRENINEDEPATAENYREIKIKLPNIEGDFYQTAHFTDRNVVAFLRVSDRDDMFFIDELQSDWHSEARRKEGYRQSNEGVEHFHAEKSRLTEAIKVGFTQKLFNKLNESPELFTIPPGQFENMFFNLVRKGIHHVVDPTGISEPERIRQAIVDNLTDQEIQEVTRLADELNEVDKGLAELSKPPNAPFKGDGWLNLGLKRGLLMAAREGKSQFGWVNNAELQDRWSDNNDYAAQYDQKMVSMVRKLTGQTPVQYDYEGVALGEDRRADLTKQAMARLDKAWSAWEVPGTSAHIIRREDGTFEFDGDTSGSTYETVGDALDTLPGVLNDPPGYWSIELTPEVREQILNESFALYQIDAYHGTPHSFEAFSADHIGTGEGAQAYGHGLYFAESEDVARDYLRKGQQGIGSISRYNPDVEKLPDSAWNEISQIMRKYDIPGDIQPNQTEAGMVRGLLDDHGEKMWSSEREILERYARPTGSLAQVEIDVAQDELLDWDLPLIEQSPKVQAALRKYSPEFRSVADMSADELIEIMSRNDREFAIEYRQSLDDGDSPMTKEEALEAIESMGGIEEMNDWVNSSSGFSDQQSGKGIYSQIVAGQGGGADSTNNAPGQIAASEALKALGIKGIKYKDGFSRGTDGGTYNYVIFDDSLIKIVDRLAQTKRGSFYPEERIIQLSQASDLSTFLHESAHLFLEVERQFAQQFGPSDNHQAILEFLDAESFDDLDVRTPEGVERHEKFARAFEAYLREGKAPSLRLRDAFAAFKRWLLQIYRDITGLDVELTDDIRQSFDRMLATDTEIAEAMSNPAYDQYFQSIEQAGMSDEEWDKYQKLVERRRTKADETITEKALRQLRERRKKEWKEERDPLIEEEIERLSKLPVYAVMADLAASPMDYETTLQAMGGEISNRLRGKLIGRAVRTEGAVDPELYAEAYGFNGVKDMLTQIEESTGLKEAATDAAQQRMIEMHGDILNDGTLEAEVEEAIHNDEQAELLLMELKALQPRGGVPINREYLRAEARRIIGSMKFSEIQPGKFYRAEIRSAKRSVTDHNPYDAKVQQLVNHYLYREAVEVKAAMAKQRTYVRQVRNRKYDPKSVDREYIANMQSLANLYDMTDKGQQQAALDSILSWFVSQTSGEEVLVDLQLMDPHLIMALEAKRDRQQASITLPRFDDMTAEDVRGVYEMLRHMRFVGGQMADRQALEVAAERRALADGAIDNGGRDKRVPGELGRKEWSALKISKYLFNKLISLRNMIRTLDNTFESEELGVFERLILQRIEGATNDRIEIANDIHDRYKDALADVHRIGISKRRIDPVMLDNGNTTTPTEEEVFMLALYWGIESSREAVRQGHGFSDADVMRIISNLSVDQLNIVNAVWEVNESVWPQLSGAAIRRYGVAPEKLDAAPFMVNGVHMTGGHMRLFYDSSDIELEEERQLAMMPTKAGSLHARVGSGGRPVLLDKNNIVRAMEENIHFIAFAEVGNDVRRLINDRDVQAAIERKHGREFKRALMEQIDALLRAKPDPESGISKHIGVGFRLLRRAATYRHLVFSVRNVVQQISALPIVASEVGPIKLIESMARLSTNNGELLEEIRNLSPFMRNRTSFVNREATEYLKTVTVESGTRYVIDEIMKYGFAPQTYIDALLAYPTWLAKYEQQMEIHGDVQMAVSRADAAVAETVGSGADIHLGGAFASTNSEFVKTLTVFGTWFNAYYQRMYRDTNGWTKARPASLNTLVLMPVLAGSMAAVLVMDFPDSDSDEEWWKWFLRQYALFLGATVPGIRDLASMLISGFPPKTPFAGGIEAIGRAPGEIEAMIEGRQSGLKTASDLTKVVTSIVPVPGSGEVTRVADFVDSFMQGREGDLTPDKIYQALVEGPDRND